MIKDKSTYENISEQDFSEFLDSPEVQFDSAKKNNIKNIVIRDLVDSPANAVLLYLVVSVFGYFVSLAICAQDALGLSSLAFAAAHFLHTLPSDTCAALCGIVFTGIPFFVSLLLLNRFRRRFILFKLWWLIALIPLTTTAFVRNFDSGGQMNMTGTNVWLVAAILTPYVLELVTYSVLKLKKS